MRFTIKVPSRLDSTRSRLALSILTLAMRGRLETSYVPSAQAAISLSSTSQDAIPVRHGISVSPKEYGSVNAKARELAAGFDIEKLTAEFYADPYPT